MLTRPFFERCKSNQKVENLKDIEIEKIIKNVKNLTTSIKLGGSSIRIFLVIMEKGFFQHFKVYSRKGQRCSNILQQKHYKDFSFCRATFFAKNAKIIKLTIIILPYIHFLKCKH